MLLVWARISGGKLVDHPRGSLGLNPLVTVIRKTGLLIYPIQRDPPLRGETKGQSGMIVLLLGAYFISN